MNALVWPGREPSRACSPNMIALHSGLDLVVCHLALVLQHVVASLDVQVLIPGKGLSVTLRTIIISSWLEDAGRGPGIRWIPPWRTYERWAWTR